MRNYILGKVLCIVLKKSYSCIILGGISPTVIMRKQRTFCVSHKNLIKFKQ